MCVQECNTWVTVVKKGLPMPRKKKHPLHNQICLVKSPLKQPHYPHVSLCVFKKDEDGDYFFVLGTNYQAFILPEEIETWKDFACEIKEALCVA